LAQRVVRPRDALARAAENAGDAAGAACGGGTGEAVAVGGAEQVGLVLGGDCGDQAVVHGDLLDPFT